jgi:hypothetical protein
VREGRRYAAAFAGQSVKETPGVLYIIDIDVPCSRTLNPYFAHSVIMPTKRRRPLGTDTRRIVQHE